MLLFHIVNPSSELCRSLSFVEFMQQLHCLPFPEGHAAAAAAATAAALEQENRPFSGQSKFLCIVVLDIFEKKHMKGDLIPGERKLKMNDLFKDH